MKKENKEMKISLDFMISLKLVLAHLNAQNLKIYKIKKTLSKNILKYKKET